jgi:predicted ribosome quality control (RQC) complex YloA/Tae2 family protein
MYAEELCLLGEVDKNSNTKELSSEKYAKLYKGLKLLLNKEISAKASDTEVYPFELESLKSNSIQLKEYNSFSEAIRQNYDMIKHVESKKDSHQNVERIQKILDEQVKLLKDAEESYLENQAKGELMYEKYQEIDNILKTIKEARTKHSWNTIRQKLNDNPEFKKIIKDIDEKNNSIIIEIER